MKKNTFLLACKSNTTSQYINIGVFNSGNSVNNAYSYAAEYITNFYTKVYKGNDLELLAVTVANKLPTSIESPITIIAHMKSGEKIIYQVTKMRQL